jgi:hypothetical protein
MTKIFVLVTAFFISFVVNASVICPSNLTCDYDSGICDTPSGWSPDTGGASEIFSGSKTFDLSRIWAFKQGSPPNDVYQFECVYNYGESSSVSIYTYVKALTGDSWTFSGFGKSRGECSDITDPTTCAGSNQFNGAIEHKTSFRKEVVSLAESSCKNACKQMHIRYSQATQYFYCLPSKDSPSGWGWSTEGNPNAALPLCECSHSKGATCS